MRQCSASLCRDAVNSGPLIPFQPWNSARISFSLSRGIRFFLAPNMPIVPSMRFAMRLACGRLLLICPLCRFTSSDTLAVFDVFLLASTLRLCKVGTIYLSRLLFSSKLRSRLGAFMLRCSMYKYMHRAAALRPCCKTNKRVGKNKGGSILPVRTS